MNYSTPGLLAEGDVPAAILVLKQTRDMQHFAVSRFVFGVHECGATENPELHRDDFGRNQCG